MSHLSPINQALLPMMRKVVPKLIAQDICGVQPMTGPTGSIFTMNVGITQMVKDFESYVCDIVDVLRSESWVHVVFSDKDVWHPCVHTLHRLANTSSVTKDDLVELANKMAELITVLDTKYPDCAFDLQMRGLTKEWKF